LRIQSSAISFALVFTQMKKGHRKRVYQIRDWFEMSKGEQRGVVVLFSLIVMLVGCNFLVPFFLKQDADFSHGELIHWKESLERSFDDKVYYTSDQNSKSDIQPVLFRFNPNTIDDQAWMKLGLHPGQIKSIRNYLSKGGEFKTTNDLSKMYVIDDALFQRLKPYVDLPEFIVNIRLHNTDTAHVVFKESIKQVWNNTSKDDQLIVELNSADTSAFKKQRGIGSYLAKKIVEYRERLGGFRSFKQLSEIYRVSPGKADTLSQKMTLDLSLVKRMNLNNVSLERLKLFPYLTHTQASALIAFREKHGPFHHVSDMQKCLLIDASTFGKVQDYFVVE
jgi:competence protein ComEA